MVMYSWTLLSFANTSRLRCSFWIVKNSHQKETGKSSKSPVSLPFGSLPKFPYVLIVLS